MTARYVPITPATCYVDGSPGHGFSVEWWAACDWSKAHVDPGPSPAGNAGPYLHVANRIEDTVHRIYPRVRRGRVTGFVREAGEWISWVVEYPDALTSARSKPIDAPLSPEEYAAVLAEPQTDIIDLGERRHGPAGEAAEQAKRATAQSRGAAGEQASVGTAVRSAR